MDAHGLTQGTEFTTTSNTSVEDQTTGNIMTNYTRLRSRTQLQMEVRRSRSKSLELFVISINDLDVNVGGMVSMFANDT